jgi:hypothetical protein
MKFFIKVIALIAIVIWLLFITCCSSGSKWCKKSNIESGKSSQHHDTKKMRGAIRIMWAKQFGSTCEVRYENKQEMFNRIYPNCDCKKVPVGTWVNRDSI